MPNIRFKRGTSDPVSGDFSNTSEILIRTDTGELFNKTDSNEVVKALVNTGGTFTGSVTFEDSIIENVVELPATDLDPDNGQIQYKTLSSDLTLTESLTTGQSMLFMVAENGHDLTLPTLTWVGGSPPSTIKASGGYSCIELWTIDGSTIYAAYIGDV